MLPRYRNLAIARDHAQKLSSGEQPVTSFLYPKNADDIEDPVNMYGTADLAGLKKKMALFLKGFGFPEQALQRRETAAMDAGLAAVLHDHLQAKNCLPKSSEAADLRIWAFLNICLIPEIIEWRFKRTDVVNTERFIGIRRNYTGYLWMAAWLFHDDSAADEWHVLKKMSVDSIVQVVERPGVGYNNVFALELGRQMTEAAKTGQINEMILMRGAMLRARFTGAVIKQTYDKQINERLAQHLISWSRKFYVKSD
jgi:hypothetical protein